MSEEIAVRPVPGTDVPGELQQMMNLAEVLAGSRIMPAHLRRTEDVVAVMMFARSLDIPLFQAANGTHLIDGRLGLYADLMRALVVRAGHRFRVVERSRERAVVGITRHDDPEERLTEYTWLDAETAGLTGKSNWKSHPAAMLVSRATTTACRLECADVLQGFVYSPDELGADTDQTGRVMSATTPGLSAARQAEAAAQREQASAVKQWWRDAIRDAPDAEEVRALYRKAKADRLLDVDLDGEPLAVRLNARGQALAEAEAAAKAEDVVDGEVLAEEPAAQPAQEPTADAQDDAGPDPTLDESSRLGAPVAAAGSHLLACGCDADAVFEAGNHQPGCAQHVTPATPKATRAPKAGS